MLRRLSGTRLDSLAWYNGLPLPLLLLLLLYPPSHGVRPFDGECVKGPKDQHHPRQAEMDRFPAHPEVSWTSVDYI